MAKNCCTIDGNTSNQLINECIDTCSTFIFNMTKDENYKVMIEEKKEYGGIIRMMNNMINELKKYKNEYTPCEAIDLISTLYASLMRFTTTIDQNRKKLDYFFFYDKPKDENFNKMFNEEFLRINTLSTKYSRIYSHLENHINEPSAYEDILFIIDKDKIKNLNKLKKELNENSTITTIMPLLLKIGYEDGIEILNKVQSNSYTIEQIKGIIDNRIEKLNNKYIKRWYLWLQWLLH